MRFCYIFSSETLFIWLIVYQDDSLRLSWNDGCLRKIQYLFSVKFATTCLNCFVGIFCTWNNRLCLDNMIYMPIHSTSAKRLLINNGFGLKDVGIPKLWRHLSSGCIISSFRFSLVLPRFQCIALRWEIDEGIEYFYNVLTDSSGFLFLFKDFFRDSPKSHFKTAQDSIVWNTFLKRNNKIFPLFRKDSALRTAFEIQFSI